MLQIRSIKVPFFALLLVALMLSVLNVPLGASAAQIQPDFGLNVIIFDPGMPVGEIQAHVDAIYAQQVDAEMSSNRYALLFMPGVYGTAEQPCR